MITCFNNQKSNKNNKKMPMKKRIKLIKKKKLCQKNLIKKIKEFKIQKETFTTKNKKQKN